MMYIFGTIMSPAKEYWSTVTVIVLAFLFLATIVHYFIKFTVLKSLGVRGPTPFPIFGHLLEIIWNNRVLHERERDAQRAYGRVYGIYMFNTPIIVTSDPEMLKEIFVKSFNNFHDRLAIGFPILEPIASMLTIVTGQKWKDIRSILSPAFTTGKLKGMMYIMEKAGDTLLQKIGSAVENNEAVDIHKWQQSVTMEVILSAAFGTESESQTNPDDKVTKYAKDAMSPKPYALAALLIPVLGKRLYKRLALSSWGLNLTPLIGIAKSIIKTRQEDGGEFRMDMLQNMLSAQHPERSGHKLNDNELIAQMVVSLLGGYHTVSCTLSLICYHLAVYPDVQERVFEEISRVCTSHEKVTHDEFKDMQYLEACISETLRLYPPGFFITRTINQSCTIKGIPFRKGMGVCIPIYALHRDEEFWPEPDSFKPERFLPENKDSINQFAHLPFGSGPRSCIGMRFAMMEIKTILVKMLQKYRLVRGPETPVPIKMQTRGDFAPAEPVMVRFENR